MLVILASNVCVHHNRWIVIQQLYCHVLRTTYKFSMSINLDLKKSEYVTLLKLTAKFQHFEPGYIEFGVVCIHSAIGIQLLLTRRVSFC